MIGKDFGCKLAEIQVRKKRSEHKFTTESEEEKRKTINPKSK